MPLIKIVPEEYKRSPAQTKDYRELQEAVDNSLGPFMYLDDSFGGPGSSVGAKFSIPSIPGGKLTICGVNTSRTTLEVTEVHATLSYLQNADMNDIEEVRRVITSKGLERVAES